MKRVVYLIVFAMAIQLGNAQNLNPSKNKIYRFNEVMRIDLTMNETYKEQLLDNNDLYSDEYLPATIRIRNSKLDTNITQSIGVRLRGNTSRNDDKKSIKISFTAYDGEKFYNHKKFNLKAENNDPSVMREYLSLHLYRNYGVPAARAHFAELYINNEYMGVYLNVEQIDDEFVDRRFEDNEAGNLYKCLNQNGNKPSLENNADLDDNSIYEIKTNRDINDRSRLKEFAAILNDPDAADFESELEQVFNVENYLMQLAIEALIGHWDSYTRLNNNYYLYEDTASMKVQFIPYDVDNTWGIDWGFVDWGTESVTEWVTLSNYTIPLAKNITGQSGYYERYCRHVVTVIENFFNEEYMFPVIDSVSKMLKPYVNEDTYYGIDKGYSYDDFVNSIDEAWGSHVYYGLKDYLSYRSGDALADLTSYSSFGQVGAIDPLDPITHYAEDDYRTGVSTMARANDLKIYPNPVTEGRIFIQTDTELSFDIIKLFDPIGREIGIQTQQTFQGVTEIKLDNHLLPGLYLLKVGDKAETIIIR